MGELVMVGVVLIAFILAMVVVVSAVSRKETAAQEAPDLPLPEWVRRAASLASAERPTIVARLPGPGRFEYGIVGESYRQDSLRRVVVAHGKPENQRVRLVVEAVLDPVDDNPHDRNAVEVLIDGYLVGFIPRKDAPSFRRQLADAGASGMPAICAAQIVGGGPSSPSYGVFLDLPTA